MGGFRSVAAILASVMLLMMALAACSSAQKASPTPAPDAGGEQGEPIVVLASQDLAVGPNRFTFGIVEGSFTPVRVPRATTTFLYLETTPYQARAQATAEFVRWPAGRAGVYVTEVSFDLVGQWGVVAEFIGADGTANVAQSGTFLVRPESLSPAIGQPVPRSRNKTASDVSDLAELTTSAVPDPDLYQITIEEAVSNGNPTVVTFATPAFCRTATCGPQVLVLSSIKDRYKEQANFIHVEVYPGEIEGDFSKASLSAAFVEWRLEAEPFTFVVDTSGVLVAKFEGFVTEEELESALVSTISR